MGFKLKSGNKPQFKQVGSSPAKHSAYGQPHPINPQGKEQPVGAGHPATAKAHNVKPEKKESPAKEGFVKEKLNRKIRRKERKADKARAQSKEALAKAYTESEKGQDADQGYAKRMYKKSIRKAEKAKKKERKADKAYAKGVKTNKRIKEKNPKRYEKAYERKIKKLEKSPAKQKPHLGLKRAKRPKKKDTVKTIQIPEKHIVKGKKNPFGGPVLKSPGEGGPKPGTGAIWNEEERKKAGKSKERQTNKYKKSPAKTHDGTKSSTTHYADGSAKSKREVAFSKRHEAEVKKGASVTDFDDTYIKRKEQLLNQGFTQKDADQMIKSGAVTGRVNEKAKAEHPKYEKKKTPNK